jgi:spore coat protein X
MAESRVWQGSRPVVRDTQVREWSALDPTMCHPLSDDQDTQEVGLVIKNTQESLESIVIKDSCDVEVTTTDTQAAVNIQVAIQAAIALIISISIADSSRADQITQELLSKTKTNQVNRQQTYIENSRGVRVTTTDTDLAVNAQVSLQLLLALIARLDIL